MFGAALDTVQHCQPTADTNRSRWPASDLWQLVAREIGADLFELRCYSEPDRVKAVRREEHARLLSHQIAGPVVSRAALDGRDAAGLVRFASRHGDALSRQISEEPGRFEEKLAAAKDR